MLLNKCNEKCFWNIKKEQIKTKYQDIWLATIKLLVEVAAVQKVSNAILWVNHYYFGGWPTLFCQHWIAIYLVDNPSTIHFENNQGQKLTMVYIFADNDHTLVVCNALVVASIERKSLEVTS